MGELDSGEYEDFENLEEKGELYSFVADKVDWLYRKDEEMRNIADDYMLAGFDKLLGVRDSFLAEDLTGEYIEIDGNPAKVVDKHLTDDGHILEIHGEDGKYSEIKSRQFVEEKIENGEIPEIDALPEEAK